MTVPAYTDVVAFTDLLILPESYHCRALNLSVFNSVIIISDTAIGKCAAPNSQAEGFVQSDFI